MGLYHLKKILKIAGLTEFYCESNEPSQASQFKWLEYTFNPCFFLLKQFGLGFECVNYIFGNSISMTSQMFDVLLTCSKNYLQFYSVANPDQNPDPPDPHAFGPPGSGSESIRQRYGSGSFYHQAKIVRKTLIPTAL